MITIFNRVKLITDTSAEAIALFTEALKAASIPYYLHTARSRGIIGAQIDSHTYRQFNRSFASNPQHYSYVYRLYVRKCDEQHAKAVLHLQTATR